MRSEAELCGMFSTRGQRLLGIADRKAVSFSWQREAPGRMVRSSFHLIQNGDTQSLTVEVPESYCSTPYVDPIWIGSTSRRLQ
jgi:hypothetical protein